MRNVLELVKVLLNLKKFRIMKSSEEIYKKLSEPFTIIGADGQVYPDLKWKVVNYKSTKERSYTPYLTVDQVTSRLNEVLGVDGWDMMISETAGNAIICEMVCIINNVVKLYLRTPSLHKTYPIIIILSNIIIMNFIRI